jgi:hypothetical protein
MKVLAIRTHRSIGAAIVPFLRPTRIEVGER